MKQRLTKKTHESTENDDVTEITFEKDQEQHRANYVHVNNQTKAETW